MHNVNGWLMALAFLLGLVLTLSLLIRRVKREVPEYATLAAGARCGGRGCREAERRPRGADVDADDGATRRIPRVDADADADEAATLKAPKIDLDADASAAKPGAVAAGAAAAAGGAAAAKFADDVVGRGRRRSQPSRGALRRGFGPGRGGAGAPSGYDIKGNEDSMLYHTPESPSYKQTIAEVWFLDERDGRGGRLHALEEGPSRSRRGGQICRRAARSARCWLGETRLPTAAVPRAGRSRATRIRCSTTRRRAPHTP